MQSYYRASNSDDLESEATSLDMCVLIFVMDFDRSRYGIVVLSFFFVVFILVVPFFDVCCGHSH